jgi:hypothetical protein
VAVTSLLVCAADVVSSASVSTGLVGSVPTLFGVVSIIFVNLWFVDDSDVSIVNVASVIINPSAS